MAHTPKFPNFFKNQRVPFKGTGTRDLIWLKVVSLDRSWLVGLTDDLKFFKSVASYFYAIETYFTHFIEDARLPKASGFSEALSKLYFMPREVS